MLLVWTKKKPPKTFKSIKNGWFEVYNGDTTVEDEAPKSTDADVLKWQKLNKDEYPELGISCNRIAMDIVMHEMTKGKPTGNEELEWENLIKHDEPSSLSVRFTTFVLE